MRPWFDRNGLPKQVTSVNGPQFNCSKWSQFMRNNRTCHNRKAAAKAL